MAASELLVGLARALRGIDRIDAEREVAGRGKLHECAQLGRVGLDADAGYLDAAFG